MAQATLEALNRPRSRFRLPSFRSDYSITPLLACMAIESGGASSFRGPPDETRAIKPIEPSASSHA